MPHLLFDRLAMQRRRARFERRRTEHRVLPDEGAKMLQEHVAVLGKSFEKAALITPYPELATAWRSLFAPYSAHLDVLGAVPEDEDYGIPPPTYDLLLIHLSVHTLNDVLAVLQAWRRLLKAGGVIVGVFWGEETLRELRQALAQAEAISHTISPRVHPMMTVQQMGALLSAAGFKQPILDVTRTVVSFPDLGALFEELRVLGETNALIQRRAGLTSPRFWSLVRAQFPAGNVEVTCDWVGFMALR